MDHLPYIMKINIKFKTQYEPTRVFQEKIISVTQICIFKWFNICELDYVLIHFIHALFGDLGFEEGMYGKS